MGNANLQGHSEKVQEGISMLSLDVAAFYKELLKANDSGQFIADEALSILQDMGEMFDKLHGCVRGK